MRLIVPILLVLLASCATDTTASNDPADQDHDSRTIGELLGDGHSIRCTFDDDGRMYGVHPQTFEVWYDEDTIIVSYETRPGALLTQVFDTTLRYPIEHSLRLSGHEGEALALRLARMEEAGCDYIDMASDALLVQDDYDKAIRDIEYYSGGGDKYLLVSDRDVLFGDIAELYTLDNLECEVRESIIIDGNTCTRDEVGNVLSELDE